MLKKTRGKVKEYQSNAVMITPDQRGKTPLLRILIAIALPITSWISAPIKASSAMTHSTILAHFGYSSLHSSAKCLPVATPSLAASSCTKSPIAVAHKSNHSNEYPAMAPACRSPSRFPGSRKAILIKNPGPVNSHNFFHENGGALDQSPPSPSSIPTITTFSLESYAVSSSISSSESWALLSNGLSDSSLSSRGGMMAAPVRQSLSQFMVPHKVSFA